MAKNLDGIKILNPEDLKKYRKVVLDYIGEKDSTEVLEKKNSSQEIIRSRKVDGLNLNKVNRLAAKEKKVLKNTSAKIEGEGVLSRKKEEIKTSQQEAERLKEAVKRQEEERKRIKEEERSYQFEKEQAEETKRLAELKNEEKSQAAEKIRLDKERIKQEKIKQIEAEKQKRELAEKKLRGQRELAKPEELKKKEIIEQAKRQAEEIMRAEEARKHQEKIKLEEQKRAEQRIARENVRLEKAKREEEVRRIGQAEKIARQAAREKKKIKRQKAWKKFKRNFAFKLKGNISKVKQNVIYVVSFLILFLAAVYLIFCLAVLRFKINSVIGWAANYLPVPAVITSQGIISYDDFRKIEDKNYLNLELLEKKDYLTKWVVLRNLREKYGHSNLSIKDDLAIKFVLDKDFNQVGLSRINKINESLKGPGGIEQLNKYADEYDDGTYYDVKSVTEKFGPAVLELAISQTSGILPRADGYYIIKRIDDKKGQLGLKYLFIKAQTLDQYVDEKLSRTKIFILAN